MNEPNTSDAAGVSLPTSSAAQASVEGGEHYFEHLATVAATEFVYKVHSWRGRSANFMQAQVRKLTEQIKRAITSAFAAAAPEKWHIENERWLVDPTGFSYECPTGQFAVDLKKAIDASLLRVAQAVGNADLGEPRAAIGPRDLTVPEMALLDWLKPQCSRLKYGQCSTRRCLARGDGLGDNGQVVDYSKATCEPYELSVLLQSKSDTTARVSSPPSGGPREVNVPEMARRVATKLNSEAPERWRNGQTLLEMVEDIVNSVLSEHAPSGASAPGVSSKDSSGSASPAKNMDLEEGE